MNKVGSRVFAVQKADDDKVCVYGRGVYEGDFEPPGGMHGFTWEELGIAEGERPKNPRIRLDSGEVVWGMQCWWGPEERFDEWMAGREVVIVPVEDLTKGQ